MHDTLLPVLTTAFAFAIAAGAPGPATLAVAGVSMAQGRRQGVAIACGLSLGLAAWGGVVALGFALVLTEIAWGLTLLKIMGAIYLFYLAWKSASAAIWHDAEQQVSHLPTDQACRLFLRGLWLNLLNPKAALAWVAALALGSDSVISVVLCALIGCGLYLFYATVFSLTPIMQAYRRAVRRIEAGFAALFAVAGIKLLLWRSAP